MKTAEAGQKPKSRVGRKPGKRAADFRAYINERERAQHKAYREVEIPACAHPRRRALCRNDLVRFARTYFCDPPDPVRYPNRRGLFSLEPAQMHIDTLREFQSRILYGGQKAIAAPRGFGKDTLAIIAALWAALYGHSSFFVFATFEAGAAKDRIKAIKFQLEVNRKLGEDFPEVCSPIRGLERNALRCKQQTNNGEFTRIEWGDTIVFPTIKGSQASGNIIAPASINANIRGLNVGGKRPTFVCISDPQTRETAVSPGQVEKILAMIRADFGGLGSHEDQLACLALVTIICKGDVADRLTDRNLHPEWFGDRYKALSAWPANMSLWEEYLELMRSGAREGDVTGRRANAFYIANRSEMDLGAETTWPDGYIRGKAEDGTALENSALQHLMNLRFKWGEDAFLSEFQNEPPEAARYSAINAELVASRLSLLPVCVAPEGQDDICVQFIDCRAREIHYAVLACGKDTTGSFVDYGIIRTAIAHAGDETLERNEAGKSALERAVMNALRERREICSAENTPYRKHNGDALSVQFTLVDSGWLAPVIYAFTQESGPRWRPCKGHQFKPGNTRYAQPRKAKALGFNWHMDVLPNGILLARINSDFWKLFAHERFLQEPGTPGAVTIYGSESKQHRTFAAHMVAEEWNPELQKFVDRSKWNHFLDCAAGCFAAANMLGARIVSADIGKQAPPKSTPVAHGSAGPQNEIANRIQQTLSRAGGFATPDGRAFLVTER